MPTQTSFDEGFYEALHAWLRLHVNDPSGVDVVEIAGLKCVVKRRVPKFYDRLIYLVRFARSFTLSLLCRLVWGERPATRTLLENGLNDEARRLVVLRQAGCRVPLVLHHGAGLLILEFVGEDLPHFLRTATPEGRVSWMRRVARDLADFHQAGFVHGGAQLRNLMYQNDLLTRIDFEENIGEAMSAPLGQAYDFYQMLSSLAGMRADEITAIERQKLCNRLLIDYLEANDDSVVRRYLRNMGLAFHWIVVLLGPALRRIPGKDVQGFLYVTNTLRLLLVHE